MAGMFTIKATKSFREARSAINSKRAKLADFKGVHLKAATEIFKWVQRNFRAQGNMHDDFMLRWPDLAGSTKRQRAKIGKWPGQILAVSGIMMGGFVPTATASKGKVENATPYARYHEFGGKNRRPPKRKMFPSERQARVIVYPLFKTHVNVSIK